MTALAPRRDDEQNDRPKSFETLDGDLVLYDRSNADAWIQSSVSVDFEEIRATGPA